MNKPTEDSLEYFKQIVAEDPRTSVLWPRHCNCCNRIFIPFRNKDNKSTSEFCHVCCELLYPRGFGFIGDHCGYYHSGFPHKKTPTIIKQTNWKVWVPAYERLQDCKFPYRREFKYFEEPDSRMAEALTLYSKQRDVYCGIRAKEFERDMQIKCKLCDETFQRKSFNNSVCPRCRWIFGNSVSAISAKLKSGEYTKQKVKKLIKDKLEDLDDDTKSLIAKGEFDFSSTPRTLDSISRERAEIIANLDKHKIVEKPIVRCVRCRQILTSQLDIERKSCQTCRDSIIPPEVRWFKGIVGLSNRSLEDIAKLPSYCHSAYTKHMTEKELAKFERLLLPFRKEEIDRMMIKERIKFAHIVNDDQPE